MDFSQQPASKHWAAMTFSGKSFAGVWFKPDEEPCGLAFRIPQESFQIPGMRERLTVENLLLAVGLAPEQVESWRHGGASHAGMDGSNPEFTNLLAPPPPDVPQLDIFVRLKPPPAAVAPINTSENEVPAATWQDLEARWKFILGLEASIDGLRMSMETLLAEMEASLSKSLSIEEKLHASRADVAQWTKAKNRVHQAVPKVKDIIHRSVWAVGAPERKRLEALYKDHIQPRVPFPHMAAVLEELEALQKARQVLSTLGKTVYQESKNISTDVKNALRTLQSNAAVNGQKKKGAGSGGGKFFKNVRKMTGP